MEAKRRITRRGTLSPLLSFNSMRKYGINISPVSGKVYIGRLNKSNTAFIGEKEEIDKGEALAIAVGIIKNYLDKGANCLVITSDTEEVECTVKKTV